MELLFYYGVPLLVANILHQFAVVRHNLFAWLAIPLDRGIQLCGQPLFGPHKTVRGLFVVSLAALMVAAMGTSLWGNFSLSGMGAVGMVAFAYMLGELPNSFVKRRLGVAPGVSGRGAAGLVFSLVDHSDSVLAAAAAIYMLEHPPLSQLVLFIGAGVAAHIAVNAVLRH